MHLRIWLTAILVHVPAFIAVSVPRVLAQDTGVCDGKWVDAIGEELKNAAYDQILAQVPHWRKKLLTTLEKAERACDPTFASSESAVHAREAMNLLEEGVDREVIERYRQGLPSLPNIPEGLIVLMGISHGAYLGTKAAEMTYDSVSAASQAATAGPVALLRQKADAGQKQTIDKLLTGLGYPSWDDFMNGKPAPASQEQVDRLLAQLKAQGIQ